MSTQGIRTFDHASGPAEASGKNDGSAGRAAPDRHAAPVQAEAVTWETQLLAYLDTGDIAGARGLVADAENQFQLDPGNAAVTRPEIAAAKARIALSVGDNAAARAILVMAIEAAPGGAQLRTLLTEVMLATGRAADARPVLQHLGQPPSDPDRDATNSDRQAEIAP